MKYALFYHSLVSDWNHGNAHFLRGVASELVSRGHQVRIFEPSDGWSRANLLREHGMSAIREFESTYPELQSRLYGPELDLDEALDGVDTVLVHEWNQPELVARIGEHRARNGNYLLLFHDTHHRAVTAPEEMRRYDLTNYDAVLAFGEVIRTLYLDNGWTDRAFTWHEAADTKRFSPQPVAEADKAGDLIWIGNWGDDERSAELQHFLLDPIAELQLNAKVYGVRYPEAGREALSRAGAEYAGWLPNYRVPSLFGQYRVTVHVPRRPYVKALPGIPTIRPFEAMACGIPLVCSPWNDEEHLFSPGKDYLVARDSLEMCQHLRAILNDPGVADELARNGRRTIEARHTCRHRVDELMGFCAELKGSQPAKEALA